MPSGTEHDEEAGLDIEANSPTQKSDDDDAAQAAEWLRNGSKQKLPMFSHTWFIHMCFGVFWLGLAWFGLVWLGLACSAFFGLAWALLGRCLGHTWLGISRFGLTWASSP
eukprot:97084-Alexandrium_andersonii.AAC.1